MPKTLRRVAVLPMTTAREDPTLDSGRDALEAILLEELAKLKRFEVQPLSRQQLEVWTGKASWTAEERLPTTFLSKIKEELGCDAVLFCQLQAYRPFAPLAAGWNMKLVDGGPAPILWSAQEMFDAGDPAVTAAARRFYQQHLRDARPLADSYGILNSPRRFGQYTISALLATMPDR